MENISLRKLTLKSKLGPLSLKYPNKTVEEVLSFHPSTIWSIYVRFEKITFTDDIIEHLSGVFLDFRKIQKPGVDKNQFPVANYPDYSKMSYSELLALIRYRKISGLTINPSLSAAFRLSKQNRINKQKTPEIYTKASLMSKNRKS